MQVDTDAEACDAIAEAIRPMLQEFKPEFPSAWIDWRYARFGYPAEHSGEGFEYATPLPVTHVP